MYGERVERWSQIRRPYHETNVFVGTRSQEEGSQDECGRLGVARKEDATGKEKAATTRR
jgi:hypothetical protein